MFLSRFTVTLSTRKLTTQARNYGFYNINNEFYTCLSKYLRYSRKVFVLPRLIVTKVLRENKK